MKSYLILHGHFYQPPRENPRTGLIDLQETASPYDDWNENIWDSCYRANAHSRYLNPKGAISSIDNNYASISFNFGPTLLSWMQEKHPETVRSIIEADKESVRRLGHGNAIAQGFNHTILPLDDPKDAELEIVWALDVFEKWFGRKSEGFWCPECAINPTVIDLLSKHGVKFVILSPWQCEAVENSQGVMVPLEGKPAPSDQPYLLTGAEGGQIAAFFYQPDLASGISFGHFLQSADRLYERLVALKDETHALLVHTATDGEIYGHHEPYGDMALCALVKKVNAGDEFTLTNYGAFLAEHPAVLHARLLPGEDGKGTSWSCSHGVSRWYKDCGCHTGGEPGWNQKWRTPLRDACNQVHRKVMERAGQLSRELVGLDVSTMVLRYAEVPCGQLSLADFIATFGKTAQGKERQIAMVCEMVLFSLYSFTSCGWFFNDLNGIEPRQDIAYALRSIELCQELSGEDLHPLFYQMLDQALCNVAKDGTGKTIAMSEDRALKGPVEAALFFGYGRILGSDDPAVAYGRFQLTRASEGEILFTDRGNLTDYQAKFHRIPSSETSTQMIMVMVTNLSNQSQLFCGPLGPIDFTKKMYKQFNGLVARRLSTMDFEECVDFSRKIADYSQMAAPSKYRAMDILESEVLGLSFVAIQSMMSQNSLAFWKKMKQPFMDIVKYLAKAQRPVDREQISSLLNEWTHQLCEQLRQAREVDDSLAAIMTDFFHVIREKRMGVDLTEVQETIWDIRPGRPTGPFRFLLRELNFAEATWRA